MLLLTFILAYFLLYKEKLSGVYLYIFLALLDSSVKFAFGFIDISTPIAALFDLVDNFLTYGIISLVSLKHALNRNYGLQSELKHSNAPVMSEDDNKDSGDGC